jgi:hypothetical protein
MAHTLHWKQTNPWTRNEVIGTIGAVMCAVTREHRLALQAAAKAVSPRQGLAEVRAMYVPMRECDEPKASSTRAAQAPAQGPVAGLAPPSR